MSGPDLDIEWSTTGQEPLFDTDPFYDLSIDPAQPWNMAPGLTDDLVSDDDVYAWGLIGGNSDADSTGLGMAL